MRGTFSHPRHLLATRPWCSVPPMVKCKYLGTTYSSIQWVRRQRLMVIWELILGLGYFGSFLLSWLGLSSANLLYREDFLLSVRSRSDLVSSRWSALGLPLGSVRVRKLRRTYPGEKPPSFSLSTQGCCLATCKPTRNLLVIPNIPIRMGILYDGPITRSVPLVQELRRHLSQDF